MLFNASSHPESTLLRIHIDTLFKEVEGRLNHYLAKDVIKGKCLA
jgi:hypothetical protein